MYTESNKTLASTSVSVLRARMQVCLPRGVRAATRGVGARVSLYPLLLTAAHFPAVPGRVISFPVLLI